MTLRYKICLFAITLSEDHGIKVDREELLSLINWQLQLFNNKLIIMFIFI